MNTPPSPLESAVPNPSQGEPPSYLLVLCSGLATTALALFGVYWLDIHEPDFQIMGWHADYVIPAGAIIVGVVAALGYGLASWLSGIKIVRGLLVAVLVFQVAAYFGAQYIEFKHMDLVYKDTRQPVGFFTYYDLSARSFAWKDKDTGQLGSPLGIWGYAFRGLEIIGFALGGVLVPLALFKKPYCDACKRYMNNRSLALLPGTAAMKKVKKSDAAGQAAYKAEQEAALASAQELIGLLRQMAAEGRTDEFKTAVEALKTRRKETLKLPLRYRVDMASCKGCSTGWLRVWQLTGQGKKLKQTELPRSDASKEFVTAIQAKA